MVMALKADSGWEGPGEVAKWFSAMLKIIKVAVLYQLYLEYEDDLARVIEGRVVERSEAARQVVPLSDCVVERVERFMMLWLGAGLWSPIDWILRK
jgi:hypothetical protein